MLIVPGIFFVCLLLLLNIIIIIIFIIKCFVAYWSGEFLLSFNKKK